MMLARLAVLLLALSLPMGTADARAPRKPRAAADASAHPAPISPIPRPVRFPGGVTMQTQTYATRTGFRPLTLDLYMPAERTPLRPALIFVHGGSWNSGDARHAGTFEDFPGLLATLARRGFVVASVNYRLSGEARFPAALQDVKSAIRWLRAHAQDYAIDTTRVAVWGEAAGGQLAAMAGLTCGVARFAPPPDAGAATPPPSDCVQAAIDWYGVTDFDTIYADRGKPPPDTPDAIGAYLGCTPPACPPGTAREASPLTYVSPTAPPFLIQQGAADGIVPLKQSQKLYDALKAIGVPAELVVYPGVAHSFARPTAAPDPDINKQAIEKIEAFLDATFPRTRPHKETP